MNIDYTQKLSVEQRKLAQDQLLAELRSGNFQNAADASQQLLRAKQVEEGVTRKVFDVISLDRNDNKVQVDPVTGELYALDMYDVDTSAGVVSLTGAYNYEFLKEKYVTAPMVTIRTTEYQTTEEEMFASNKFFLHDVINKLFPAIEAAEDAYFKGAIDVIIASKIGQPDEALWYIKTAETALTRTTMTAATKMLAQRENNLANIISPTTISNDILGWDAIEIGDTATTELFTDGLKYKTIWGGVKLFSVLKEEFQGKRLYFLAGGAYLGKFYEWKPPTVEIEKKDGKYVFRAKEWISMIVMASGVSVLELT